MREEPKPSPPPAKSARDPNRPARALLFRTADATFPTVDAAPIAERTLDEALAGLPIERASTPAELTDKLRLERVDVLVLPYGSAFPIDAWPRIKAFLHEGGGLAILGGAPFHEPVRRERDAWIRGPRSTAFAHDLLIGPAEAVPRAAGSKVVVHEGLPLSLDPRTTWALTIRVATKKDFPAEHGSDGPREAIVRPLSHVVDARGTPRGAAVVEIDHRLGSARGARWVLATSDATLDAKSVRAIVARALEGSSEVRALPVRASVKKGERADVRVVVDRFAERPGEKRVARVHVTVTDERGRKVAEHDAAPGATVSTPTDKLAPGLYRVAIEAVDAPFSPRTAQTAFWVRDDRLLASAPKLSVSRDWLRKDGRPFPVVGTTYMASDVHRQFLFEPNPAAWDADFADMKRRGIGFVRTGLWTAWSRVLGDTGGVDENVLAAFEAYVQTAARHGIVVCFDFFAFLPPAYGASHPYLDPHALERQETMLRAFAGRVKGSAWVHWDLINEPSYAPPAKLWSTRAIGDAHEKRAWTEWVKMRHGLDEGKLRAIWREPGDDVLAVPGEGDWAQTAMQIWHRPRKTRDFRELTEDIVTAWAARMRGVLRSAHGEATLVTLGQDEGGIHERPTQQLLASALDYSAVHTWWKNDDLLWDGVVTKVPEKPILHQETGLMRLEDLDGTPWRTPEMAASLLERKLGYAFAGRGAGVVEWAWNINPTMPIDEESTIGLFRPDGTAKPELDALESFAAFFAKAAPLLDDFAPDPVVLVVPHARAFLGRIGAIDATKIVVRALAERFGIVPTAISDLRLSRERLRSAKLVLVPCADVLDEPAAKALLEASRAGTKVLFTGPIEGDSYGLETPSLRALGVLGPSRPVAMHEKTAWSDAGSVAFEGLLQESARRADKPSVAKLEGAVWHEPLPIELAREREPLAKLLEAALAAAGVPTMPPADPKEWGVAARVLVAPRVALVTVVNERAEPASRRVVVDGRTFGVPVRAFGARLALIDRASGDVVVATPGESVTRAK